jgi:hypothetical protein
MSRLKATSKDHSRPGRGSGLEMFDKEGNMLARFRTEHGILEVNRDMILHNNIVFRSTEEMDV